MQITFLAILDKYLKWSSWFFHQSSITHINRNPFIDFVFLYVCFFYTFQMHLQTTEPHYTLMVKIYFHFKVPEIKETRQVQKWEQSGSAINNQMQCMLYVKHRSQASAGLIICTSLSPLSDNKQEIPVPVQTLNNFQSKSSISSLHTS